MAGNYNCLKKLLEQRNDITGKDKHVLFCLDAYKEDSYFLRANHPGYSPYYITGNLSKLFDKCEDVVKVGDVVRVKITAIDNEKQKVSLSIRALLPSEKEPEPLPEGESAEELVYEVSETGEASGVLPEEDAPAAEEAPAAEDTLEA